MKYKNYIIIFICVILSCQSAMGAKTTKIKLTGSNPEDIVLIIGNTGRTEVINMLPYEFEVSKDQLPLRLKFKSESYLYYDIDVPAKPFDTTGHVYLVKINESAMALKTNSSNLNNTPQVIPVQSETTTLSAVPFNSSKGVNNAPLTGNKNDNTFALIIANEDYELAANVAHATNDGLAFKEYCLKTLGLPNENIKFGNNLSFGKMRKAIADITDLVSILKGNANLIIYYAGHGIPDNKTKDAYLLPVDADGTDSEVCISLSGLYEKIENTSLNRCVVFIDACFSGAQRDGEMIVAARGVKLKPKEATPKGKTIVFSATSDDEAAFSHKEECHGLFTFFLLTKLQETKGKVTLGELADYVYEKVALESRRINNMPQTPRVSASIGLGESWKSMNLLK